MAGVLRSREAGNSRLTDAVQEAEVYTREKQEKSGSVSEMRKTPRRRGNIRKRTKNSILTFMTSLGTWSGSTSEAICLRDGATKPRLNLRELVVDVHVLVAGDEEHSVSLRALECRYPVGRARVPEEGGVGELTLRVEGVVEVVEDLESLETGLGEGDVEEGERLRRGW